MKQMKLLHPVNDRKSTGFSEEEQTESRKAIYRNILDSIVAILEAMERFGLAMTGNQLEEDKFKVCIGPELLLAKITQPLFLRFYDLPMIFLARDPTRSW